MSKSIIVDYDSTVPKCFISHSRFNLEKHHCMNGRAERKKSEEDGLWVYLTSEVHRLVHNEQPNWKRMLKEEAQKAYERIHSHDEWMRRYGKNYL